MSCGFGLRTEAAWFEWFNDLIVRLSAANVLPEPNRARIPVCRLSRDAFELADRQSSAFMARPGLLVLGLTLGTVHGVFEVG